MITLTAGREIGPTLLKLRLDAGISLREVARRAHISTNGVWVRERSHAGYLDMFIEHAHVLGWQLALIPQRHPGARPTGTGWPA